MPGYHAANIRTITTTADGRPVEFKPNYAEKYVLVYVAGVYSGTFKSRSAAVAALNLKETRQ